VRANYGGAESATIGVNRLTSDEPLWFTLADVIAAKVLGGKTPRILAAHRFEAGEIQPGLRPVALDGVTIDPRHDDFFRFLIDLRRRVQDQEKAAPEADKAGLRSLAQSIKILANSTSYGIYVELNTQPLDRERWADLYDFRGKRRRVRTRKIEEPGIYFHPLLATLITGAARLMLALAERLSLDQGLGWAFCDTDSLAIANVASLPAAEFVARVENVRAWFEDLNPYEVKGSILQLEKVNFPPGKSGDLAFLRPLNCLAVSAKRYVLFDRAKDGSPVIRKASAHGLGQYIAPAPDPERRARIERIGVELWQEAYWREVIRAADSPTPDLVDLSRLPNFDQPAASRYAATNRTLLAWFDAYNEGVASAARIGPFNFLLSFQHKSDLQLAGDNQGALDSRGRRQPPKPASRYSSDLVADRPPVFDRRTGKPVKWEQLRSYARALARHHMHPEMKFRGGDYDERGTLQRRHVHMAAAISTGKEGDNLEERHILGENDGSAEWAIANEDRRRLVSAIEEAMAVHGISVRRLTDTAGVSHHTLTALRAGRRTSPQALLNLFQAVERLRQDAEATRSAEAETRRLIGTLAAAHGSVAAVAGRVDVSRQYLNRVLTGQKAVTKELAARITALAEESNSYGIDAGPSLTA
jgi:hypothetical protein